MSASCSECLDNGLVSPHPGVLVPCSKCLEGQRMAERMEKIEKLEKSNQDIPCGFCGEKANTESGCNYIGKSIFDPNQKPICQACLKKYNDQLTNRKIKFKIQLHCSYPICQECFALVMPGHEKDHAKMAHQCENWEIITE